MGDRNFDDYLSNLEVKYGDKKEADPETTHPVVQDS